MAHKAFVTGCNGFLGQYLVRHLAEQGFTVRGFDLADPVILQSDFEFVRGDIRDEAALRAAASDFDLFFHCAAISDIDECRSEPRTALEVNVLGTLNAIRTVLEQPNSRFMLASSYYAMSDKGSIYKTTKMACEQLVWDYATLEGLNYTIMRFGSLYGPGAGPDNAIRKLLEQALNSGKIKYWGNGTEIRDYIHIEDAARLAVKASGEEFSSKVVNISGIEKIKTRDLLDLINEIFNHGLQITLEDTQLEGRYHLTPFSLALKEKLGNKILDDSYRELGAGLLDTLQSLMDVNS
jgi:UDP-glucose 4-epimerase